MGYLFFSIFCFVLQRKAEEHERLMEEHRQKIARATREPTEDAGKETAVKPTSKQSTDAAQPSSKLPVARRKSTTRQMTFEAIGEEAEEEIGQEEERNDDPEQEVNEETSEGRQEEDY